MTDEERWAELVEVWKEKHDALVRFPLFDRGMMRTDRLDELEKLRDEEAAARAGMDAFLESRFPGSKS